MKFTLALMFQNDAPWLYLHLRRMVHPDFGLVGLDGGSTDDSADIVRGFGGQVFTRPFDWNFSAQGNALIAACEEAEYDAMLRLDPDEAMFRADIFAVRELLETYNAIWFSRFNFIPDRLHYAPLFFPDWQCRAWRLNKGVQYNGKPVHEMVNHSFVSLCWHSDFDPKDNPVDVIHDPAISIYHYGALQTDARRWMQHDNYRRLAAGEPVLTEPPVNAPPTDFSKVFRIPFTGIQPIDPEIVGDHAPFESKYATENKDAPR